MLFLVLVQVFYIQITFQKILDKYKHDNLTVVCVTNDGKSKLKLYDQIVSINNKSPFDAFPFKPNDKLKIKIIRSGKIINTTITTTETSYLD